MLQDKYWEIYVPWISNYPSLPAGLSITTCLILDVFTTPTSSCTQKQAYSSKRSLPPGRQMLVFMSGFCWTEFLTQITAIPVSQHIQINQGLPQIVGNLRFQKRIYIMHLPSVHWSRNDELSRAIHLPLWHLEAGGRILNDNYTQTPAEHRKKSMSANACWCTSCNLGGK